jgi:hypothetical protein
MMPRSPPSKVIPLDRIGNEPVGGKAAQLAQLVRLGLRVPEGFVIVGAGEHPPAELDDYSMRLGGAALQTLAVLGGEDARPQPRG